jgi:hypothetical protein
MPLGELPIPWRDTRHAGRHRVLLRSRLDLFGEKGVAVAPVRKPRSPFITSRGDDREGEKSAMRFGCPFRGVLPWQA